MNGGIWVALVAVALFAGTLFSENIAHADDDDDEEKLDKKTLDKLKRGKVITGMGPP